ncbi:DUF262 domain-containing protein [uncultured Brachyspira sp.]|uniref:DUF262 domain-containing protein n=1 Tax=uncultured Brachyspira sp. TaxID=221953 RepID=UPI0025FB9038|nr:DUF262 domain-containing protein [uncultured Brachyspira sp.]
MSSEELKTYTLYEIFDNDDRYRIPIYQRNFAWGEKEILELLLDIYNQYKNDKESNYYIGSLIVAHKENDNIYDVIDGQQRLTVISLIYIYLIEKSLLTNELITKDITIYFEIRDEINEYLKKKLGKEEINEAYVTEENGLQSFEYAFNVINNFFNENFKENEDIKKEYTDFLFDKVQIIRIILPKDTDLIEYFEIMNTRGEQLELHDILKARLLSFIEDKKEREKYSNKWDICSNFNMYVQYALNNIKNKNYDDGDRLKNIFEKMENEKCKIDESITDNINKENRHSQFESIIDFPNFLLHSIYLFDFEKNNKKEYVPDSFNDKFLLKIFDKYIEKNMKREEENSTFSKEFIESLLEYRKIFDNYIIKKDNSEEAFSDQYRLRSYKKNESIDKEGKVTYNHNYICTITNNEEEYKNIDNIKKINDFIIHLQTILEILTPAKHNKTWLYKLLKSLISNNNQKIVMLINLTNTLWNVFREDIYSLDFKNLSLGTATPHRLFYYIDFLILLEFKLNPNDFKNNYFKNDEKKFKDFEKIADDFKFASVGSIEHIYSQKQAENIVLDNDILHSIGNLCLISSSQNTLLGKWDYNNKRVEWEKFKRKYSLKQALVFCKYDKWGEDDIKNHQEEIISLLEKYKDKDDLYSIITENKKNEY